MNFFTGYPHKKRHFYNEIPWRILRQVLDGPTTVGLGERIREEIISENDERSDEFDSLDLETDLNQMILKQRARFCCKSRRSRGVGFVINHTRNQGSG